ncbi:HSP-70 cofactor [Sedimentisphaera cyanobacteriorum]|uniref:Protein GrpE n=1 Tax=Sedimentisphaera cyanobacteriorum TaxID=1940790 RepID=A0A1Q2HQ19_9BACT|nr:nucleotide exchange factor GrpE [Sedimentisphaera cyanobacteriorum]AQQ09569.1 HSP-70 cofactor [Sedimentisphaera cyanobacteriorum]
MTEEKNKNTQNHEHSKAQDINSKPEEKKADLGSEKNAKEQKKLSKKEKIEQLQKEYNELEEKFQRLRADYANYQKRVPKMIQDEVNYKVESFIKALLPGLDNFEHAIKHSENSENVEGVVEGVQMVYSNLLEILKTQGLEQIAAKGEQFDPSVHRAVVNQSLEDKDDGVVLEEIQKGYRIKDKVVRPAMVAVNKLQKQKNAEQSQQPESENKSQQAEAAPDASEQNAEKGENSEQTQEDKNDADV